MSAIALNLLLLQCIGVKKNTYFHTYMNEHCESITVVAMVLYKKRPIIVCTELKL